MPAESLATKSKRRLLGLTMLVVIAALVALSVAFYNKTFTKVVKVTLQTDSTGNQLQPLSDVKVRGILVGEVRSVTSRGEGADIELALDPSRVSMIPANVSAQLLPKTLFGERYVSLVLPSDPQASIRGGDVIPQDRSASAIAVEKVLNDVLPLLQAVRPADLNATLNALATALSGRGEKLGENLAALDSYLSAINPHVDDLLTDLDELGQVSTIYNQVAPDLLSTLSNLQTTSAPMTQKASQLDGLLRNGASTANVLNGFFSANGDRIISVSASSAQILSVLAEYSPEYPCLAAGLAKSEPRLEQAFGGQTSGPRALNITLEVVKPRGAYLPGDEPRFGSIPGPTCQGLPNPTVPFPGEGYGNGKDLDGATAVGGQGSGALADVPRTSQQSGTAAQDNSAEEQAVLDAAGSKAEQHTINALVAGAMGTSADDVPAVTTLLAGPLLRGAEVSAS